MSDHDFNTPPWFLELIRAISPRKQIGLDPCSNEFSMVEARKNYYSEDNGLLQSWRGFGMTFVNPPHSMSPYNIEPWMDKAYHEFFEAPLDRDTTDCLSMLVPVKMDTGWAQDYVPQFSCRCFLRGRPKYWHLGIESPGSGKFASMVLYQGPAVGRFMTTFSPYGWCV